MKNDHDASGGTADGRTRDRVVRRLLEGGSATAAELSRQLGVSPAGIRRHLDAMVADGILTPIESRPRGPRGRGRPAKAYALTDAGHQAGPSAYPDLATSALSFLAEVAGPSAVSQFAEGRAVDLESRVRSAVAAADPADRAAALAEAMTAAGYTASISQLPTGLQICQHHCPVQFVAERFPELCDAETAALGRVLDTHVQRLATIAHGDGVCTTHIPAGGAPPAGALAGRTLALEDVSVGSAHRAVGGPLSAAVLAASSTCPSTPSSEGSAL